MNLQNNQHENTDERRNRVLADKVYLPVMLELSTKVLLIVGGGKAALQKLKTLCLFDLKVLVVSPELDPSLQNYLSAKDQSVLKACPGFRLYHLARNFDLHDLATLPEVWLSDDVSDRRAYLDRDLKRGKVPENPDNKSLASPGFETFRKAEVGLVYACTDNVELNAALVKAALRFGLPVCDTSRPENGNILSPATLKEGNFTLSVGSGGRAVKGAVSIREALKIKFHELSRSIVGLKIER